MRQRVVDSEERDIEIHCHYSGEYFFRHGVNRRELAYACVNEEHIYLAEFFLPRVDQLVYLRQAGRVRADRQNFTADFSLSFVECLLVTPGNDDPCALFLKLFRCCQTNTGVASRDNGYLAFQFAHCVFLSYLPVAPALALGRNAL